jgi:1-acyl-sn-glycerol-3-phosphate acyltransferase
LGEKFDVFISYYSKTGRDFAKALKKALQENGWRAFFAESDILTGQVWEDRIRRAISDADYFILLHTTGTEMREWVRGEYRQALSLGKTIIPCIQILGDDTLGKIYRDIETAFPGISKIQAITWKFPSDLTSKVIWELKRLREEKEQLEYRLSIDPYPRESTPVLQRARTVGTPLSQGDVHLLKLKGCAGRHERELESVIDQVKFAIRDGAKLREDSIAEIEILINEIELDGECIKA